MNSKVNNKKEVRRWVILAVDITSANQIVRIDRKLPAHLKSCKGILVSVKSYLDVNADVVNIGEVSLSLNTGNVHPFHFMAGYSKKALGNCKNTMEINETITPNHIITGFYKDLGTARNNAGYFLPYSLNIYLDCRKNM